MTKQHVVAQGECMSTIARRYGFEDWKALYDHSANAALKKRRPNPNALVPGDIVAIPEPIPATFDRPLGAWHTLQIKREKPRLRVRLSSNEGKAFASRPYRLTVSGRERFGTTDGDGMLDEPVPAGTSSATVSIRLDDVDPPQELVWRLAIGHLDPVEKISGVQARLRNLGYYTGAIDGRLSDALRAALGSFQLAHDLDYTGQLDESTISALASEHDGQQ
jgi:hypothetical protein